MLDDVPSYSEKIAKRELDMRKDFETLSKEDYLKKWPSSTAYDDHEIIKTPLETEKKEENSRDEGIIKKGGPKKKKEKIIVIYAAKPVVDCCIPTTPRKGQTYYEVSNGKYSLSLTAVKPKLYDLPYGKDRLYYYWLKTHATRTKSKIIQFHGVNSVLEELGLDRSGVNTNWLRLANLRGHHSIIYYTVGEIGKGGSSRGELMIPKIDGISFDTPLGKKQKLTGFVHLSDYLFIPPAVPIDLNDIAKLGKCWISWDLYCFIRRRLFKYKPGADIYIPPQDLIKQFGLPEDIPLKRLKETFKRGFDTLHKINFPAIPGFNKNHHLVIPNVRLPSLLNDEMQKAFEDFDNSTGLIS
jgi:hypothetical protein